HHPLFAAPPGPARRPPARRRPCRRARRAGGARGRRAHHRLSEAAFERAEQWLALPIRLMEFKSEAHKQAYDKTRDYLHALFGEVNVTVMSDTFALQEGSTFVYVRTFPIGDNKAGVEVFS